MNSSVKRPAYPIESVENALKLILWFKRRESITVAEAATELGVARSTAHRLLAMLQAYDFVRQISERSPYTMGTAFLDVGARSLAAFDVRVLARPYVERLSRELNESATFGVRLHDRIVFVETSEGRESLRVSMQPGDQFSAHGSAIGRALLALLDERELLVLFPDDDLPPDVDSQRELRKQFASRAELFADLQTIRNRGYAVNYDVPAAGVCAVAAAVCDARGGAVGSIAVSAPTSRVRRSDIAAIARRVMDTARELGEQVPVGIARHVS